MLINTYNNGEKVLIKPQLHKKKASKDRNIAG